MASVTDIAYQTILERIVSGRYAQNSKLPTEAEFARELGISRPMVRAAIARLRESGLVVSRRGSGSYVFKQPSERLLKFAPIESIADIQRCYEYRIMLEGEAAFFAAERATPSDMERMQEALHRMDAAIERRTLMLEEDSAYHLAICHASDNQFIVESYQSISDASHAAMKLALTLSLNRRDTRRLDVQREHHAVFDAIRSGDRNAARTLMQAHIRSARRRVFEGPET
jgi:DNA-binding FadR family transcriptional regulator